MSGSTRNKVVENPSRANGSVKRTVKHVDKPRFYGKKKNRDAYNTNAKEFKRDRAGSRKQIAENSAKKWEHIYTTLVG